MSRSFYGSLTVNHFQCLLLGFGRVGRRCRHKDNCNPR